ncbi:MAG: NADH-quinone oxidoreductase subunit A [Anaerolineae bacterium]|nr:NADH-quinone oxidoreductase subunit A [Anaerolineae bacterium]
MTLLLSPPIVMALFMGLTVLIYWIGGKIAARSDETPGKHEPYACGEDLTPSKAMLSYHSFFRLALMFGLLHVSALVLSTLPMETTSHRVALVYIVAVGISVFVLTGGN